MCTGRRNCAWPRGERSIKLSICTPTSMAYQQRCNSGAFMSWGESGPGQLHRGFNISGRSLPSCWVAAGLRMLRSCRNVTSRFHPALASTCPKMLAEDQCAGGGTSQKLTETEMRHIPSKERQDGLPVNPEKGNGPLHTWLVNPLGQASFFELFHRELVM